MELEHGHGSTVGPFGTKPCLFAPHIRHGMQRQALKDVEEKVLMVSEVDGVVEKTGYPTETGLEFLCVCGDCGVKWRRLGKEGIYSASRSLFPFSIRDRLI